MTAVFTLLCYLTGKLQPQLSELMMTLFAVGVSTRKISHLLQLLYDMRISAAELAEWERKQLRRWSAGLAARICSALH